MVGLQMLSNGALAQDEAKDWVLKRGRDIAVRGTAKPALKLEGQKLSGSTGCNLFNATLIEKPDKRIAIENVSTTRKLCGRAENRTENAFLSALRDTAFLNQQSDALTFLSAKRRPLLVWEPAQTQKNARALTVQQTGVSTPRKVRTRKVGKRHATRVRYVRKAPRAVRARMRWICPVT
jgi:heat shock protein HslJ